MDHRAQIKIPVNGAQASPIHRASLMSLTVHGQRSLRRGTGAGHWLSNPHKGPLPGTCVIVYRWLFAQVGSKNLLVTFST